MSMKLSDNGFKFLCNEEGKKNSIYDDATGKYLKKHEKAKGNPTIGIGHLIITSELFPYFPEKLTDTQVYDLFKKDLVKYETAVNKLISVKITQNQYDALVSLCFNIGINGFTGSTVLRLLNKNDYKGATEAFLLWFNPGLLNRRIREKTLFLKM